MLKKISEKQRAKFPAAKPSCSMVKIGRLFDPFLGIFKLQASLVEGQSPQQKGKKRKNKGKGKNFKI